MVATAAVLVSEIIGKARRDGKIFYYINDGVYHTFSGVVYDHWIPNFHAFKPGRDGGLRRGRPDLRQLRQDLALGAAPGGPADRRLTSTRRTSAPTASPRRPGSTASKARRFCT